VHSPVTSRPAGWLVSASLAVALAACGGGSTPDPLNEYRTQTVQWGECDATITGGPIDALYSPDIEPPAGRLQCAQVRAPMDWSEPQRGDISLAVMRMAAGQPDSRRGALFFNPGGPGIDGLSMTLHLWAAFADSNPASAQGAQQLRLLDEYDLVGFSPRGLGASTRLSCATNELERTVDYSPAGWDRPENIANVHYNGRKQAEACARNPLTPYINTDATARDMDLLRGLLGDEKLNYLGYSYGTWLGAWYASLFPQKVGRMVLDSATDFSAPMEQMLHGQPPARQRLFDEVLAPYAARHPGVFRLGATEAEVRAVMPRLGSRVQAVLAEALSGLSYNRSSAVEYLGHIAAAQGLDAVLLGMPDAADAPAVHDALARHPFAPGNEPHATQLRETAWALYGRYQSTWLKPEAQGIQLDNAAGIAVRCNDTPATTDPAQWLSKVRGLAQQAPMYFGGLLNLDTCAHWGGPSVRKPDPAAMQQLPVLFVQSQYDAATNTDDANRFFAQLPGARRVYVAGDFQHAIYPYSEACVDTQVTAHLLGETPKPRETTCQGKPLQGEDPAAGTPPKAHAADSPPVYRHPEKARALIEQFKRGLVPH
jgi:pimeloyl-ACP methyl ester carboxylesterase